MRQLVLAPAALALSGCSLIYNPSDLPDPDNMKDARVDAEIVLDSDPTALTLERVSPALVIEGTGDGMSRQGVITVHGKQIIKGAKIAITPHAGETIAPMITVDDDLTDVADNGFFVAAPYTIKVNDMLAAGEKIRLDVTVTQPGPAGDIVVTLAELPLPANPDTAVLELQGLNELSDNNNAPLATNTVHEFSQINITGALTPADTTNPLIVRTRASAAIGSLVNVRANGQTKGPGGNTGGAGVPALTAGKPGQGPGAGQPSGGGGGFGEVGGGGTIGGPTTGQPQIITHAANRSSGGASGDGGALSGGGAGGAGGGSIEITAGGTLSVTGVDARGGNGASNGGGGSGGLVLLRGNTVANAGTIDVSGGTGANAGGAGRIRIDAATAAAIPSTTPAAFRGPVFDVATPLLTRDITPTVKAFGANGSNFTYRIFDETKMTARGPFTGSVANGSNTFELAGELFRGVNTLCITVEGGNDTNAEATSCIEIVYVTTI